MLSARVVPRHSARRELLQALLGWTGSVRREPGALQSNVYEDVEDEAAFRVEAEWADAAALEGHLRSDLCGVLLGALELLAEPPRLTVTTTAIGYETEPLEMIRRLREGWRPAAGSAEPADDKSGRSLGAPREMRAKEKNKCDS